MIEYIKGNIAGLTPTYAIIDNNGIGYFVNISLYTFTALQNAQSATVYIYEAIREDAHTLFGFTEKNEREMFLLLISVSGVGPNSARMILSSLSPTELQTAIATSNVGALKAVKGIGAKTAQRIIVDLKDKIKAPSDSLLDIQVPANNEVYDEALAALVMLGFSQQASQKVLKKLLSESQGLSVEKVIKQALKMM
ncbi:MAG: Holliday junction branch migration protein RuvA [Muribaculaceae bacterium]|jgi:Holliday junction DNA helicase RuvA|nr:Holliday junction branch migration protein RuvA [Muribaculaceae bacterium]MEE1338075.1 Holliday junction branch migration protein RuvA [Muribaculaceae bacterium]